MNRIFNNKTVIGKFLVSLAFAVATLVVAQVGEFVTANPELFSGVALLVINAVLFAARNLLNPRVKNV